MSRPEALTLQPIRRISGTVSLPGSKSLSNRILLFAALAEGTTKIRNLLDSDDIRALIGAFDQLGVEYTEDRAENRVTVVGQGGPFRSSGAELMLGNAGTAMRPLTAALTLGQGRFVLDGAPRMRERPIQDLVDGLVQLGATLCCTLGTGCPPVEIEANGLAGGTAHISGTISSQYLSALLMAAPYARADVILNITDTLVSQPYVEMTLRLMERFGVQVNNDDFQCFHIHAGQTYQSPGTAHVEGDASSASYFLGGAAVTGGTVTVEGCGTDSLQGDARFAEVLEQMGAEVRWKPNTVTVTGRSLRGVDVDMNPMPDAAMTLAVVALFAEGSTAIRNIHNWRVKETERLEAVCTELRKLGAVVEEGRDYLVVTPPETLQPTTIDTYDDHRMAMAFSLAACGTVPVVINDPGCVCKTFPDYFDVLSGLVQS
ncbi:MAG TPA: 3-phosphoshikimate 1-carboxyvinyltransferase [Deltaproteobacteria bacterium]|nr:3-phosphoshikimate 1-carboxyvinyltransferase [Deltaproteobacteria bacterium]